MGSVTTCYSTVWDHSVSACLRVLTPKGTYLMIGEMSGRGLLGILSRLLRALILSRFVSQRLVVFLARPIKEYLLLLQDLMKAAKVTPVIDKRYRLSEVSQAIRHVEEKHARGKVVITLGTNNDAD